jgi:RNA polymerase sigma factor (sigma-70 family)
MIGSHPPDLPQDVIARALDGEPAAFRKLHERYDPTVRWAVGLRVYRWPELVPQLEDIVQEVWCELTRRGCKRLRYHSLARGVPFSRFLALITARLGWRLAKRRLGHPEQEAVDVLDGDDGFAMRLMNAQLFARLAALVDEKLDEKDRCIFHDHYVAGDTLKDIGARLALNENATYKRHERLLAKLHKLAEELLGQAPHERRPELVAVALAAMIELAQSGLGGVA